MARGIAIRTMLVLVLVPVGGATVPRSALAASITVTTSLDDPAAGCTLRDAIRASNTDAAIGKCPAGAGDDTIVLTVGTTYEVGAASRLPSLTDDVTILGNGSTVVSGATSRVIEIAAGVTVAVHELTITHEFSGGGVTGRGLLNRGITTLEDVIVTDNLGLADGAGVWNGGPGATLVLVDSTISGNRVDDAPSGGSGGGIHNAAGGSLTITDSSVVDNRAPNGRGGGIDHVGAELAVTDSTISDNWAIYAGGVRSQGPASVLRSTIADNAAEEHGGMVQDGATASLVDTAVTGNRSLFGAGGVHLRSATTTMVNATISGNDGGNAGGIGLSGGSLDLTHVTVIGNWANISGGIGHTGVLTLAATVIAGNGGDEDVDGSFGMDVVSGGSNVIGSHDTPGSFTGPGDVTGVADPLLGPLANNGGPTLSHQPLAGSPTIDRVSTPVASPPPTDQRGVARPVGAHPDAGAVEDDDPNDELLAVGTLVPVGPVRVVDTRDRPIAATVDGEFEAEGAIAGGMSYEVRLAGRGGIPSTAVAAVVNLTTVDPVDAGFLTIHPCRAEHPLASAINYGPGDIVNNEIVTALSPTGTICIYARTTTHLVIDAVGYAPESSDYVPVDPARLADSRSAPSGDTIDGRFEGTGPVPGTTEWEVEIAGRGGIAEGAAAVVLNLTTVEPAGPGFVTVHPCEASRPLASAINYGAGDVVNNEIVAELSPVGTICVYARTTTHLVIDAVGYVPDGADYLPVDPARFADTRAAPVGVTIDGTVQGNGPIRALQTWQIPIAGRGDVPADATTAVLNVTTVDPTAAGFLTIHPCRPSRPLASTVNFTAGAIVNNETITGLSPTGAICVYSSATTDFVIDVVGSL